jgi:hypothetical protein
MSGPRFGALSNDKWSGGIVRTHVWNSCNVLCRADFRIPHLSFGDRDGTREHRPGDLLVASGRRQGTLVAVEFRVSVGEVFVDPGPGPVDVHQLRHWDDGSPRELYGPVGVMQLVHSAVTWIYTLLLTLNLQSPFMNTDSVFWRQSKPLELPISAYRYILYLRVETAIRLDAVE